MYDTTEYHALIDSKKGGKAVACWGQPMALEGVNVIFMLFYLVGINSPGLIEYTEEMVTEDISLDSGT